MIYLGYQHSVKMIVMQYNDTVSSSECSSGLTWYMFMHVVEKINIASTIFMFMVIYILLMLALNVG